MKAIATLAVTAALGILAIAASAQAQTTDTVPAPAMGFNSQAGAPPAPPMPPMPPDEAVSVVGAELGPGHKIVKGAPLSAQTQTEMTQVLANGTHIDHKSSGAFYRDNLGRMRVEMTHPPMGSMAAVAGPGMPSANHQIVFIMDPVIHVHYVLEPERKIAREAGPTRGDADMKGMEEFHEHEHGEEGNVTTESLGTQTINGVSATGTRTTRTIPMGAIGNDAPLLIVTERWYSPALQMNIMTKHTDPRMGTTTYQLTNISREEPSASLFQVPADYTVEQGGPIHMRHVMHTQQPPPPGDQPNTMPSSGAPSGAAPPNPDQPNATPSSSDQPQQ